jgi:hypothetical protein
VLIAQFLPKLVLSNKQHLFGFMIFLPLSSSISNVPVSNEKSLWQQFFFSLSMTLWSTALNSKVTFTGKISLLFPQSLVRLHLDEKAHYEGQ